MKPLLWAPLLSTLCLAGLARAQTVTRVTDDAHHSFKVARPFARVISLAPSLTEMLYEAGAGDRLVGAVEHSDYPMQARKVPRIGGNQRLDVERIATLKPDLVLVWFHGNAKRELDQLTALGVPMFYLEPHRIQDIPAALERIGQLMGTSQAAHAAAERFRARHASLQARYADHVPVRVFYQIAANPLLTINDRQLISDAIRLCGGLNVFGQEPILIPQVSTESVVAANPDVILTSRWAAAGDESVAAVRSPDDPSLRLWARFSRMKAARTGQLWLVPGNQISRHGPRILEGVLAICTALDEARKARD